MNNIEFETNIVNYLEEKLSGKCEVVPTSVLKNNGTILRGIRFVSEGNVVQPTVYLNNYRHFFEEGKSVEEIGEILLEDYNDATLDIAPDLSFFYDYSSMKDRVMCKLINLKKNKELLKDVPHVPFLDLAVVFYCRLELSRQGVGTILIHNCHLKNWGIDVSRLYEDALNNNGRLLGSKTTPIGEMLTELMELMAKAHKETTPLKLSEDELRDTNMYVLTNKEGLNGAACMLDKELLQAFSKTHGGDYIIIPSSVHELILLPGDLVGDAKHLKKIVKYINGTEVSDEDVLSDEVYIYDSKKNAVVFAQ